MNLNLLTCFCIILCSKLTIQSSPRVRVSLDFVSFKNPNSKDLNGDCCEKTCTRCDYFFKICIKDNINAKCIFSETKTWSSTTDIVFNKGTGALGKSLNNPFVKELPSWKGKLIVYIEVMDEDLTWDDLVDRYSINKPVTPTAGIAQQTWTTMTVKGVPSTLTLRYSVQCFRDYYGPSCTKYCLARDDNQGHYTCDLMTGSKVCRNGWYGNDCLTYCMPKDDETHGHYKCDKSTGKKVCLNGWYDASCKTFCMARNDSRGGYTCDSTGSKICLREWYPISHCNVFCSPRNDSASGYTCDLTTGQKTCLTGWFGPECDCSPRNDSLAGYMCNLTTGERICHSEWYGGHCNVFCSPKNDSNGHYSCNPINGAKECLENWFGKKCDVYCAPENETNVDENTQCTVNNTIICARNWYGANCSVHCEPRDDDESHYTCNQQTGQKICLQGWYGESCSIYCIPRDNDWFGHYNCDVDGNKVCHESWYGTDCNVYCKSQNSSLFGHYLCMNDGARVCLENWYGTKCLRFCEGRDDDQGHYKCSAAGAIICLDNWYAENCTVYCVPHDDDKGHYTCDPWTGQEVCLTGWTGANCKDEVMTRPPTTSGTQQPPENKENRQTKTKASLGELPLALILGGFLLLICLTVGVSIIVCSRKQTKRKANPFPYLRYNNTTTKGSLERAVDIARDPKDSQEPEAKQKRESRIPNLLSKYDDNACNMEQKDNVVISLQEVSWNQDGSRNVDEKLVMYNNPLFIERHNVTADTQPTDPRVDPATGLRDNSDWVAIFDSYSFE